MSHETGHVKRNVETGEVAVRTIFPEDQSQQLANMAWLVATTNMGARHCASDQVADWDDLFVVEPAPEPEVLEPPFFDDPVEPPAVEEGE